MFIFCHKNFNETKLSNHQILSGTNNYPEGYEIDATAGAAAKLDAAANVAKNPGASAPIKAIAVAASSCPGIVSVTIITSFSV